MEGITIMTNDRNTFDDEILKISLLHFRDNPLFTLLPIPNDSLAIFWKISDRKGPTTLVAVKESSVIGFRSGAITSYKKFQNVGFGSCYKLYPINNRITLKSFHIKIPKISAFDSGPTGKFGFSPASSELQPNNQIFKRFGSGRFNIHRRAGKYSHF